MSVGLIVVIILFLAFVFLMLAPIYFEIDSRFGIVQVRYIRLLTVGLLINEESLFMLIKIAFWNIKIDLLKPKKKNKAKKEKPRKEVKKKGTMFFKKVWRKMKGIAKSFKVNQCIISVDTGDMVLNGQLYPWIYLLSKRINKPISINFMGETIVILQVQNSLGRLLWAVIRN